MHDIYTVVKWFLFNFYDTYSIKFAVLCFILYYYFFFGLTWNGIWNRARPRYGTCTIFSVPIQLKCEDNTQQYFLFKFFHIYIRTFMKRKKQEKQKLVILAKEAFSDGISWEFFYIYCKTVNILKNIQFFLYHRWSN